MSVYRPFIATVATGIRNPFGLAAVAATGQHESGYSPKNAYGAWSDPSESGQAGTAGGILSWRAERLQRLQQFAADSGDDPNAPSPEVQAQFFLQEDPALIDQLNSAGSIEEAQSAMNNAWKFAGYDRPGGEAANRLATAQSILGGAEIQDGSGGAGQRYTRDLNMGSAQMAGYPSTGLGGLGGLGGMAMEEEPAPQGGIAGFFNNPGVLDVLRAAGLSMMSSPSNNMFAGMAETLPALQRQRLLEEATGREQQEKRQTRGAWNSALRLSGLSDEEAALMANSPDAAAYAVKARTTETENNRTKSYLKATHPDLYAEVEAGGRPLNDALSEANERRKAALKGPDLQEIYDEEGRVQKGFFRGDQFIPVGGAKSAGDDGLGLQPVPVVNADGTFGYAQLSKGGAPAIVQFPDGVRPYNPSEISEARARGGAIGKGSGEAAVALPGAEGTAARVKAQIDDLKNDAYLPSMTGPLDSRLPSFSGDAARVQSKMDQLQGGAFLEARQMLKGGGAITDFEGKKAEDAFARLNTAQNDADYVKALDEFNYYVEVGLAKLQKTAGSGTQMPGVNTRSQAPQPRAGKSAAGVSWSAE